MHDPTHSEQQAYERYLRFSKIELGSEAMPRGERWRFYCDLLPFEPMLVHGNCIGLVPDHPFRFEVTDHRPFVQKPISYSRQEREWLCSHMDMLCKLGVVRRVEQGVDRDPTWVQSMVLVRGA